MRGSKQYSRRPTHIFPRPPRRRRSATSSSASGVTAMRVIGSWLKKDAKELTDEEALAKAQEIRKKLVDGADFATLAKAESDDAGSGANGGDLGTFGKGRMVPAFEQVAFTIAVGELSEPVKS